jgi:YesN/AraC family two-component response regulator
MTGEAVNKRDNRSYSILAVEDSQSAREIMASILAIKFPNISFYFADNGKSGLDLYHEHSPDIVITDINMPEMDGIQMCEQILRVNSEIKLIVLTASREKSAQEMFISIGTRIHHYISKPLNYNEFFNTIEQCLDEVDRSHPQPDSNT